MHLKVQTFRPSFIFPEAVQWAGLDSFPGGFWPLGLIFHTPGVGSCSWIRLIISVVQTHSVFVVRTTPTFDLTQIQQKRQFSLLSLVNAVTIYSVFVSSCDVTVTLTSFFSG